ncbi:hypothetical protein C823_000341 [Eubacterium plexicaudatum ASF492]|uniref:Uncharacterized protein n=1 Tax=Eubacterium plexicaudatum ASF492 TaxID=1235802 RepID=N2AC76_9FIRM|nr:hypothetical protein C823_000341 [Eubacterium plexicaudatum ASF492]
MQISSRFTLAVHILACIDAFKDDYKVTSDFLAGRHHDIAVRRYCQCGKHNKSL